MTTDVVPVVFIHGMWMHASSWQPWTDRFAEEGYDALAPGWPGEKPTVAASRANPDAVAGLGVEEITEHYRIVIRGLETPPVLVGHSFGGLIAQKLLGEGLGRAAIAIAPAQIKGVKPLPFSQLRSAFPVMSNPANRERAVTLTPKQFRYAFGNAIPEAESNRIHETFTMPSPGRPLFEASFANFTKHSPVAVDTRSATRGPLLLMSGQADHIVPDVVTRATFKLYGDSTAVTELKQFPGRGHSLTVDSGWRTVADFALGWLARQGAGTRVA